MIAFGAFVLAALGSLWLARMLTEPIDRLVTNIAVMTAARDERPALAADGQQPRARRAHDRVQRVDAGTHRG